MYINLDVGLPYSGGVPYVDISTSLEIFTLVIEDDFFQNYKKITFFPGCGHRLGSNPHPFQS